MLDIPQTITVNHKIDAKDLKVALSIYDADKKTLFGAPIDGVIMAAAGAAAIMLLVVVIRKRKGKAKKS